jgi:hydroxypyruvate isomerase
VRPTIPPSGLAYAPNISWLLPELPAGERPRALAEAGFRGIEFGFPSSIDLESVEEARQEYGLEVVLFNQDVPVWDRWNRGYLSDPQRRDEFRRRLDEALALASRLEAKKVMLPAGVELPDVHRQSQHELVVENLRYAAPLADQANVMLTLELINSIDHPGYFLDTLDEAAGVVREVDHPNLRLQLDTYHLRMLGKDLPQAFQQNAPWVGHIQFGDFPKRCQPGTGSIDFPAVLQSIKAAGYRGYIGLEFVPKDKGLQALAWVPDEMRARRVDPTGAHTKDRR